MARSSGPAQSDPLVGVIGAGNYACTILLPALAKTSASLACIADLSPVAANHSAREFHFAEATTDYQRILLNDRIAAVFIATEHSSHARLVRESLAAGKHVFVEKPLCLTESELSEIAAAYHCAVERTASPPLLMVGFNRRYSPHTRCVRELLRNRFEPLCMNLTVNPGPVPPDHWLHDPARGGGRIIGEACHFLDLLSYLASSPIQRVSAMMPGPALPIRSDKMSIQLTLADGSIGALNYFANGSSKYPKETLEIFSEGRILRLENFRVTRGFGFKRFRRFRTWRQDKGHRAEIALFMDRVRHGGPPMIPFVELENATRASFVALVSAANGKMIQL
jgi:predicted dehydrogenase